MISGYVSVGVVAAKLYRDLGINKEIDFSNIVEWSNEVLLKVGAYSQFKEISECIELTDGKACLPNGFYKLVDIMYQGQPLHWATNTLAHNYQCEGCMIPKCCTEYNFYINDSYIITDIKNSTSEKCPDKLCMVYLGMPVDCDGYPMMPDDVYYDKALKAYCTYMLDKIQFRKGILPDKVYQESKFEWNWNVGAAKGSANTLDTNAMQRIKNIWVRLIPRQSEFRNNFNNLGKPEQRHLH